MKDIILKWALKNAYEHEGKAQAGSVINGVIGEKPEWKADMRTLGKEVAAVIKEVNAMGAEAVEAKLRKSWPESFEKRDEERRGLPELPNATPGKVVMRMAPNPDGAVHIGNSRQILLNWFYVRKYKGK